MSDVAKMLLKQLRVRFGAQVPDFGPPPLSVEVRGMSGEMWLMVDPPRGEDTVYALEREWKPGAH